MQSVRSRRRLPSTARLIHLRDSPLWFGPGPMAFASFVASTQRSRLVAMASPHDFLRPPGMVLVGGVDEVDAGVGRLVDQPAAGRCVPWRRRTSWRQGRVG